MKIDQPQAFALNETATMTVRAVGQNTIRILLMQSYIGPTGKAEANSVSVTVNRETATRLSNLFIDLSLEMLKNEKISKPQVAQLPG